MIGFLIRRLGQAALVIFVIGLLSFVMFRFVGDPVQSMTREDATIEEKAELRERLGLDDPVTVQFVRFVERAAQGDFGISYRNQRPVSDMIAERLPATLELVLVATVLALAIGIPLGVVTAINPRGPLASGVQAVSLVGVSTPTFVTGIL